MENRKVYGEICVKSINVHILMDGTSYHHHKHPQNSSNVGQFCLATKERSVCRQTIRQAEDDATFSLSKFEEKYFFR